jgi:hypothetical protein
MNYLQDNFPNFDCDEFGNVYKDGILINPFKSNEYLQVYMKDKNSNVKICGVHTVIAMKYLDYFDGCVVHHKDGNRHNNNLDNLEIYTRQDHSSLHAKDNDKFNISRKNKVPWNKGIKMPSDFCERCSKSAKNRKGRKFNGNQYVDAYGNKR